MDVEILVPVVALVSVAVVLSLVFFFRYKARNSTQETIRAALDKGHELSPEIIESLGQPKRPPRADLRLGLIWLALAAGLATFGLVLGEEDAVRPFLAIAAFPFMIGVAYVIISRFSDSDTSS